MGVAPLTYTEIQAWARLTRQELTPAEALAIFSMSSAYANIFNTENAPCPTDDPDILLSVDMVNINALIAMAQ